MTEPTLHTLFNNRFPYRMRSSQTNLVALCDAHDLVAVVTEDWNVDVYRLGGQRAFTVKRPRLDAEITALRWKADGSRLAVGWNDGSWFIVEGEKGRVLSQSAQSGNDVFGVRCFGWTGHVTCRELASIGLPNAPQENELDLDWAHEDDTDSSRPFQDLPRTLSALAVDHVLPCLSAIPSHSATQSVKPLIHEYSSNFATQHAVDSMFHTKQADSLDEVDLLLACNSNGAVDVLLDEGVVIGRQYISSPLAHASHPHSAVHSVLSKSGKHPGLRVNFLVMPLSTLSSPLLPVVALRTKQLHNLVCYISQSLRCLQSDFTEGLKLPSAWISNIDETLAEKQEGDLVSSLFQLAMTGHFTPTMLEWLVDIIREQNHKRWDEKVNHMYAHVKNHLHINLLPALDRIVIAASTLRGHARFHEGSRKFDVSPNEFTAIIETAKCLRMVAHRLLLVCMTEHKHFRGFSKWLRVQIDVGAAGPGSKSALETEEREVPNMDYHLVLGYIKDTMMRSDLAMYIDSSSIEQQNGSLDTYIKSEDVQKILQASRGQPGSKSKSNGSVTMENSIRMAALGQQLGFQCRTTSEKITEWQSRMLTLPTYVDVETIEEMSDVIDMRMAVGGEVSTTFLVVVPTKRIHRLILHTISHPLTARQSPKRFTYDLPKGVILDLKLIGYNTLVVLFQHYEGVDRQHYLLSIHLDTGQHTESYEVNLHEAILHSFPAEERFIPVTLLAGGREGRKVCIVFGGDGRSWKVLDLEKKLAAKRMVEYDDWEDESMDIDA